MRLVPGKTLAAAIADTEPPRRPALLRHVVSATEAHAHGNRIIHRDLKPGKLGYQAKNLVSERRP